MAMRVGVVLSGCGVFDGSEIHEAVSILIALDRRGAQIICLAPNIIQAGTINHLSRRPEAAPRRVLEESARIARGNIRDIASIEASDLDALIFPGGFGAAKNLCSFASDGPNCKVNDQVERLMLEMHAARKPIGLACIAPVLAARVFGARNLRPIVTIGTDPGTANAITVMKAQHRNTPPTDVCVDEANRLVTTPCYMTGTGPWQVYQGADKMVEEVLRLAQAK
ncbi:MAG: isoprenoid biosynthesis glyoxalase ElbB [Bacillota bacterium]